MSVEIYSSELISITSYVGAGKLPKVQILDKQDYTIIQMDREEFEYICAGDNDSVVEGLKAKLREYSETVDMLHAEVEHLNKVVHGVAKPNIDQWQHKYNTLLADLRLLLSSQKRG